MSFMSKSTSGDSDIAPGATEALTANRITRLTQRLCCVSEGAAYVPRFKGAS